MRIGNVTDFKEAKIIKALKNKNIDYLTVLITISFILLLLSQAAVILSVIIPYQKEFGYLFKYPRIWFCFVSLYKDNWS